jgi:hypothetical protein
MKRFSAGNVVSIPPLGSRSMPLPQRMQRWRVSRAGVDITIPHEHSSTGMESSPTNRRKFASLLRDVRPRQIVQQSFDAKGGEALSCASGGRWKPYRDHACNDWSGESARKVFLCTALQLAK